MGDAGQEGVPLEGLGWDSGQGQFCGGEWGRAGQGWKGFQDRWNIEMVIKVSGDVYPLMTGTVRVWRAL